MKTNGIWSHVENGGAKSIESIRSTSEVKIRSKILLDLNMVEFLTHWVKPREEINSRKSKATEDEEDGGSQVQSIDGILKSPSKMISDRKSKLRRKSNKSRVSDELTLGGR